MKVRKIAFFCLIMVIFLCIGAYSGEAQTYLYVDVFSVSTNARVSGEVDLGEINPGAGLYLLPYYFGIEFPADNFTAWGIQLYTDNNPEKTWTPLDGIYGGLRGRSDPLQKIPLYWQVYASPQNVTTTAGGLGFYAETLAYWGRVRDVNDQDVTANWMSYNNLMNRTLVSYKGLGAYPVEGRNQNQPPVYLYLGMDVSGVTQSQKFGTTLRMDLYNLGVNLSRGGYATPNPFTPMTGQRTNFNFFLKDIESGFVIRIYTVRGRLIRTITREREWDGRNDRGELVEGGLYIYQIEAEGERVSGTVVLIK